MAWTAPMTAVANAAFTSAQFNLHVRDNLNETAVAKATTQGGYFVTTALNSIVERLPVVASIASAESTTSTSFTDLATVGPTVTTTTGPTALVLVTAQMSNNTAGVISRAGFEVSGATTVAAAEVFSLAYESGAANDSMQASFSIIYSGLTSGSNTFAMKYKSQTAGTASFSNRRISVIPF